MCGRLNITDSQVVIDFMGKLGFDTSRLQAREPLPRYNVAPTDTVFVGCEEKGRRSLREMVWWLTPAWAPEIARKYAMFNARSESVASSPAFRGAFQHHRAVIPVSGFIEWQKTSQGKQPYYVMPPDGVALLAGLWSAWDKDPTYESCTILTTESVGDFQRVHHRTPLVLLPDEADAWLSAGSSRQILESLMQPRTLAGWTLRPLSSVANNARNKSAEAAEPVAAEEIINS